MNSMNMSEGLFGRPAIPISQLLRQELVATIGLNDIVDQCTTAYALGKYTGMILGDTIMWSGGLNGGAKSAFWSGGKLAKAQAALQGTSLERTPIGGLLDIAKTNGIPIPESVWRLASATFAGNASGEVEAVILNSGKIWSTVEAPILRWRGLIP
jgi:hypothetical protein